jgi:hypothetical protein
MLTEIEFESPGQGGRGGPPPVATYPRGYRVQVSSDGQQWSAPVAEGKGSGTPTSIPFAPVRARFVRITQTETTADVPAWVVRNIKLYQAGTSAVATR